MIYCIVLSQMMSTMKEKNQIHYTEPFPGQEIQRMKPKLNVMETTSFPCPSRAHQPNISPRVNSRETPLSRYQVTKVKQVCHGLRSPPCPTAVRWHCNTPAHAAWACWFQSYGVGGSAQAIIAHGHKVQPNHSPFVVLMLWVWQATLSLCLSPRHTRTLLRLCQPLMNDSCNGNQVPPCSPQVCYFQQLTQWHCVHWHPMSSDRVWQVCPPTLLWLKPPLPHLFQAALCHGNCSCRGPFSGYRQSDLACNQHCTNHTLILDFLCLSDCHPCQRISCPHPL